MAMNPVPNAPVPTYAAPAVGAAAPGYVAPIAPPSSARQAVQAANPALTITGALSTITGVLMALGATATTATGIMAGLHIGAPYTLYLAYASGADTVAMSLIHALATQFGGGSSSPAA